MTKVARIFEEEKLQALAKVEEEKRLALAKAEEARVKAEEENKLNLAKERMVCVFKMIQKIYPSEEIASIVSGFTVDEIDAIRKEMSAV